MFFPLSTYREHKHEHLARSIFFPLYTYREHKHEHLARSMFFPLSTYREHEHEHLADPAQCSSLSLRTVNTNMNT